MFAFFAMGSVPIQVNLGCLVKQFIIVMELLHEPSATKIFSIHIEIDI